LRQRPAMRGGAPKIGDDQNGWVRFGIAPFEHQMEKKRKRDEKKKRKSSEIFESYYMGIKQPDKFSPRKWRNEAKEADQLTRI